MLSSKRASRTAQEFVHKRYLRTSAMALRDVKWADWRLNPTFAGPSDSPMLAHQSSLPKFPVPDLGDTVAKALRFAEPLAKDRHEYTSLEKKARAFVQGEGTKLQNMLQERAENTRNWLSEWWDLNAYMTYRDSIVINVTYFYGFEKLPQGPNMDYSKDNPAYVAATLVLASLNFRDKLIEGSVVPDEAGGVKQDMDHYKWMVNACRIPWKPADYPVKISEDDPRGDHFIIIRHNRYFKIPIKGIDGKRLGLKGLEEVIQKAFDQQDKGTIPFGVLTAANRDLWTDAREHMLSSGSNKNSNSLDEIEKSAFIVAFDDHTPKPDITKPASMVEFSRDLWHGDGNNRFFDKPIQWVVYKNGESGMIGEHSCMDGTPTARMANEATIDLLKGNLPAEPKDPSTASAEPEELEFDFDDKTNRYVKEAQAELDSAIKANSMHYLMYTKYGKDQIKQQKTSPDGWVQMAMQLAYYMTYGHSCGTYEAASVRRFDLGRTETVRVCTKESLAWVQAMLDKSKSNNERRELFKVAVAQHGKVMKESSTGNGIDRHLSGLKWIVPEGETMPDFLADPLLKRSSSWDMSTSQIYGHHFIGFGWGCVTEIGHGFAYLIRDKQLQFTVASRSTQPNEQMVANIETALDTLMDLMRDDKPPQKAQAKL